jgi:hypothetical protein
MDTLYANTCVGIDQLIPGKTFGEKRCRRWRPHAQMVFSGAQFRASMQNSMALRLWHGMA